MIQDGPQESFRTGSSDESLPPGVTPETSNLVADWLSRIGDAKGKHKDAFKRMEEARQLAAWGAGKEWVEGRYTANIIGAHIQAASASLYASNPTCIATPKRMLDFAVWDGSQETLMAAQSSLMAIQAVASGMPLDPNMPPPTMEAGMAQEILQDYQEGNLRRQLRVGTATTLQAAIQDTWDLEFKLALQHAVRRSLTCGVAYARPDLYRTTSRDPHVFAKISDTRTQIAHIEAKMRAIEADSQAAPLDPENSRLEDLRRNVEALEAQAETVEREGVEYSFPDSDALIIDPECTSLLDFAGAKWVAERIKGMNRQKILESYRVDIAINDKSGIPGTGPSVVTADTTVGQSPAANIDHTANDDDEAEVAVYEVWHKPSRTRFTVCDGHAGYLEEPREPDSYTSRFWPWIPIVFNDHDMPKDEIFPPSDVMLLRDAQEDINNARQGIREHRRANRPMLVAAPGVTDEELTSVIQLPAFTILRLNSFQPGSKVGDLLQPMPVAPIDPQVYDTSFLIKDIEVVGGSQQAHLGAVAGSTATENAIAAESRESGVNEDRGGLDDALSILARTVGEIMLDSLHAETIIKMVGPGAVWPEISRRQIADELQISIRAGSAGRPNKAMAVANMERIIPYLQLVPGVSPEWLARKMIELLEADIDLDEAMAPGLPSIATINEIDKQDAAAPEPAPAEGEGAPPVDGESNGGGGPQFRRVTRNPNGPAFDSSGNLP